MDAVLGVDQREPQLDGFEAPPEACGEERALEILVIDPDSATANMVTAMFANARVRHVPDVYCALNELSMERADVVITELRLPGAGVVELLRRLQVAGIRVPVVVLSHARGSVASLRALGVSAMLTKPVGAAQLEATVRLAVDTSARHVEVFHSSH